MANLDSAAKRNSGFGISLPFTRPPLRTLGGSDLDTEAERAHFCMNYNGIALGVAGGRIMSSMAGAGGLAGRGGIAGEGGGLAG